MKDIRHRLLATFQLEHRDHVEQIRSLLALAMQAGGPPESATLDEVFRRAHSLKGAARAVDLRPVEQLAHRLETLFSHVRQGGLVLDTGVAGDVQQALNASEDCVAALGENRPPPDFAAALAALDRLLGIEETAQAAEPQPRTPPEDAPAFQPLEMVRVSTRNFDGMLRSAGGLITESHRQIQVTARLRGMAHEIAGIEKEAREARRAQPSSRSSPVLLDSLERRLHRLSRNAGAALRLQQRSAWNMSRLGKQLQHDVWQARMVPAESLLEGHGKMLRDLARDTAKAIEFRATATGVHADRRVLDALKAPLLHLLRNAVSHGIETPEERAAKGKPSTGTIRLTIGSQGRHLTIEVEDDGRGVDLARVAEVATEQGILPAAPRDLTSVLFRPGFSTARSVTELSGRGMGLSVVYETVRRLHGEVELRPREGGGAHFRLSVPVSIATHRLLLLSAGERLFAVPLHSIERLHRIELRGIESAGGKPAILLDNVPVPLFTLRQLLGLETGMDPSGTLPVMVVRTSTGRAAIVVDAFLWESNAVIQDLGPTAARGGKLSGGVVLDDGRIAFVLDFLGLLASDAPLPAFPQTAAPQPRATPASILVVDDSMTTRTLEKSILEANGYRVRVAVDGLDALAQLRTEKVDLVISDIQMPHMDGFGLLEAIKADASLQRIPLIIVSSLDRREDRARGLELGADAYIVKRKFDQEELLSAIRQIV